MFMRIFTTVIGLALLLTAGAPTAVASASGADRPFAGSIVGHAMFGYGDGGGTPGLSNVLGCNMDLPPELELMKVTSFTSADGTAHHLGRVHVEFDHCPDFTGMTQGQVAFVAADRDVLYGEYTGTYTEDGASLAITFRHASSTGACHLLNGVGCESTGRFANAEGGATMIAFTYPGDENDPFIPWPWWATWTGTLSY